MFVGVGDDKIQILVRRHVRRESMEEEIHILVQQTMKGTRRVVHFVLSFSR